MSITREFGNNFAVTDWTEELNVIPNQWGTIAQLGLFREEGVDQYTLAFDEITKDGNLIVDKVRGERATANKDYARKTRSWSIPHFPYDDYISPSDIKGKRAYGKPDQEDSLAEIRARKMERIAQNHNWTLEFARSKIITTGDVYAPNGTVSLNYYTEFGITRKEVDFVFGTGTTDIIAKQEELVGHMLDNASGEVITEVIGLASPEFFSKLISHANVKAAYTYYASTQEPLRNRVGGGTAMHRTFTHGNVRYIEMRDKYNGTQLIPAGDCYFVPLGTGVFKTFFAPANKFAFQGTVGERMYMFEYASQKGDKVEIETETNFLNALLRPALVTRAFSTT